MSTEKKPAPRVPPLPSVRSASSSPSAPEADWLALVRAKVAGLAHGTVQIIVHDGRITQVESTEKLRLPPPSRTP